MKDPDLVTAKNYLEHLGSLNNTNETDSNIFSDHQNSNVRYKKLIKTKST